MYKYRDIYQIKGYHSIIPVSVNNDLGVKLQLDYQIINTKERNNFKIIIFN